MRQNFYNWFISVLGMIALMVLSQMTDGTLSYVFENDQTPISMIISVVFIISTISIGILTWKNKTDRFDWLYFASQHSITLGLFGTVAGLVILTSTGIDPNNIEQTVQVLRSGMGTALLTTAMGILSSLFLDIQLALAKGKTSKPEFVSKNFEEHDC